MRMRPLGRTGLKVSPYCLGTMMFGPAGTPDPEDCRKILHRALDAGINFVDTADVYGGGETEVILGKALKGRRDDVVLATKFSGPMGEDPNRRGASRRWIVTAVEDSLRRLGVDHVDLYQIHHFDPATDLDETLSARSGRPVFSARTSSKRSGSASSADSPAFERNSPVTPSSLEVSNATSCPSVTAVAWECSPGARWPGDCSPASTAPAGTPPSRPAGRNGVHDT
jgi:hypothetical protein